MSIPGDFHNKELMDLEMQLHGETSKAIKVSDDGDEVHAKWLPKSVVEFERKGNKGLVTVTMPAWLAAEKGLL